MIFRIDKKEKTVLDIDAVKLCPNLKKLDEKKLLFVEKRIVPAESVIYSIVNGINGNEYIGSTIDYIRRKAIHICALKKRKHHSSPLQRAWNKYGEDNFSFNIIEVIDNVAIILEREQHYIDTKRPVYNVNKLASSRLGVKASEETKRRISIGRKGIVISVEHRLQISKTLKGRVSPMKGRVLSDETRKKLSDAKKGKPKSEEHKRKIGLKSRRTHSAEQNEKQRLKMTGIRRTEEQKRKLSIALKGRIFSDETKLKMAVGAKQGWITRRSNLLNRELVI